MIQYASITKGMATFRNPRTNTILIQTNWTWNARWNRQNTFAVICIRICIVFLNRRMSDRRKAFHNPHRFPRDRAIRSLKRIVGIRHGVGVVAVIIIVIRFRVYGLLRIMSIDATTTTNNKSVIG